MKRKGGKGQSARVGFGPEWNTETPRHREEPLIRHVERKSKGRGIEANGLLN